MYDRSRVGLAVADSLYPGAEVSGPAVTERSMDQPTMRRLKVSSTTAQYTLPSRGRMLGVGRSPIIGSVDGGPIMGRLDLLGYLRV